MFIHILIIQQVETLLHITHHQDSITGREETISDGFGEGIDYSDRAIALDAEGFGFCGWNAGGREGVIGEESCSRGSEEDREGFVA